MTSNFLVVLCPLSHQILATPLQIRDDGMIMLIMSDRHRMFQLLPAYVTKTTRHRESTSMYSLTFCVRVVSPERHHWKPAV